MKVLMLGWELPPYNSGGMGVACYQMCKELSEHGVSIEFILPYEGKHNIDFMKLTSVTNKRVKAGDTMFGVYDTANYREQTPESISYERGVESIAKLGEFDIIHAHEWLTMRAAIRAKQVSGKPLIVHIHATEFDRAGGHSGNPLIEEIEYMGMMIADKIIAVSEYTRQVIINHYRIPGDKIEVVHNSVDVNGYDSKTDDNLYTYLTAMKEHGWRVVSNIGRLTVQKGLTNLMRAMQGVVERVPKTLLLIVGSGDQYEELIELANDLGIGANVLFVDFQRGKALRDAFTSSDLFVMPSVSEPFGIAPLEAIAFGTPTLVSKQSGVAEVIRNCLKVDFWDVNEMVNQISAVVQNDSLRDELHAQSFAEFQKLNWKKAATQLRNLYRQHAGAMI